MLIVVNPSAGGGRAARTWERLQKALSERFEGVIASTGDGNERLRDCLAEELSRRPAQFVAAGGDGTVNWLVNQIMLRADPRALQHVNLGAIGLGSSNDFHKPWSSASRLEGRPAKLDFAAASPRDVCAFTYENEKGGLCTRYWLLNASIGITAQANYFFNHPNPTLRFLKRRSTSIAILYAALHTITHYRHQSVEIASGDQPFSQARLTNLGIVKNPHFSGSFCYDSPYEPDSGCFHIHLCADMRLPRILYTLSQLSHRKFTGLPGTRSWRGDTISVRARDPFPVEFDGEVVLTRFATFGVKSKLLRVCPC